MKRLLSLVSVCSFCLVMSFTATGCGKKAEKKPATATASTAPVKDSIGERFAAAVDFASLNGINSQVLINFKNGDPFIVDPTKADGVSAKIDGKSVIFTQIVDAPQASTSVVFTVKGGRDGKEETRIKITLEKKK